MVCRKPNVAGIRRKLNMSNLSVFVVLVLRHNPAAAGITLDKNGWADVNGLINGINRTGRQIDFKTLAEIVATDKKRRFAFNSDKSKIRASQGHSVDVDLELEETAPPKFLYHGTAEKYFESIKRLGVEKRTRNFVHLSPDEQTALKVGSRHGSPVILKIDAQKMADDGFKFFISENGVWLTDRVPFEYVIEIIK